MVGSCPSLGWPYFDVSSLLHVASHIPEAGQRSDRGSRQREEVCMSLWDVGSRLIHCHFCWILLNKASQGKPQLKCKEAEWLSWKKFRETVKSYCKDHIRMSRELKPVAFNLPQMRLKSDWTYQKAATSKFEVGQLKILEVQYQKKKN